MEQSLLNPHVISVWPRFGTMFLFGTVIKENGGYHLRHHHMAIFTDNDPYLTVIPYPYLTVVLLLI